MKKILSAILMILTSGTVFAVTNINASDYEDFDSTWAGQKVITNKEFEDTMTALEEKKNKKDAKQKAKKLKKFKGESLHKDLDATIEDLPDQTIKDPDLEEQVVLLHVDTIIDGKVLEKGYYRAIGEKKDGKVFINLYQSHELKARINAHETDDDFGEQDIMFIKVLPYKDGVLKLIYGSIEVNAYAFVRYIEPRFELNPQ